MKYTKEQRLAIGCRIYNGEIAKAEAAIEYGISEEAARKYMRLYRDEHHLPPMAVKRKVNNAALFCTLHAEPKDISAYESMSKEELIQELLKARITEARLKKGYEVKGDGSIIRYSNKNIK